MAIEVTYFSDPGCPWAYSVNPALAALRWRYGDQLEWRLVTIGLTERAEQYVRARLHAGPLGARLHVLPPATGCRSRPSRGRAWSRPPAPAARSSRRACDFPSREFEVFRALQFAWFTTPLVLDEDDDDRDARSSASPALDVDAVIARLDDPDVDAAYERDRAEARTAAGSADRAPGQGRDDRRPGPLHRPVADLHRGDGRGSRRAASRRSRPTTCSSRTSTRRSSARQPPETTSEPRARALPRRPDDAGGRRRDGAAATTSRTAPPPRRR